jgi:hypothetical protein
MPLSRPIPSSQPSFGPIQARALLRFCHTLCCAIAPQHIFVANSFGCAIARPLLRRFVANSFGCALCDDLSPILLAAPSRAPRDNLWKILLAAPSRADSFSCAIKRPSQRFVDFIGCAIARPLRRFVADSFGCAIARPSQQFAADSFSCAIKRPSRQFVVYFISCAMARVTSNDLYHILFWPPSRAPLAMIYIVDSFGPRDVLSILLGLVFILCETQSYVVVSKTIFRVFNFYTRKVILL